MKRLALLIYTHYWSGRVVWTRIHTEYILHLGYEAGVWPFAWDAPLLLLPGFEFVFFRISCTLVSEMLST